MASHSTADNSGVFFISKVRVLAAVSLLLTWWIASLLPDYQPIIRDHFKSRIDEARQKIPSVKVDWTPTADPRAAYNASKVAMIIEPRVMPHLVPQLLHMIAVVPPDWRFLFVGSPESTTMLSRSSAVNHQQIVGKLDLLVLPEPWDVSSKEMVYRTLTDMRFYDEFLPGVEWLLKYEYDSIMCANSEQSLNEWLDWHWAGAPRTKEDRFSGNGGLSLRRVSAIRKILGFQARYNDSAPEDEWFGGRLYITPGLKVASGLDGALAVENVYMEKPMGYHVQGMGEKLAPEVWGSREQRKKILEYCPELYTVLNAKLDRERCPGDKGDGVVHPTPAEKAAAKAAAKAPNPPPPPPSSGKTDAQTLSASQVQVDASRKALEAMQLQWQEDLKNQAEANTKKPEAEGEANTKKPEAEGEATKGSESPASAANQTDEENGAAPSADEGGKEKEDEAVYQALSGEGEASSLP